MKKYQNGGKKRLTLSKSSLTKIKNAQNNVAPKSNIVGELMTGPAKAAGAIIVQGSTGKMLISAAKKLLSKAPKGKLEREIARRTTNVIARDMAKNTELQQVAKNTAALARKSYAKKLAKNPGMKFKKGGKKLHLGFKETQAKIAKKQGISMEAAGAILASSARKASPAAVKKNPALLNVKRGKVKKYADGGKTNKGIYKGVEYNSKGDIISKYDVSSKKGDRNQYLVYADGKPVKHTYNPTTNTSRRAELDTLGYSKGKQSFTKTVELKKGNGKIVKTKTKVPRKSVLTQIKSMQTMQDGGKTTTTRYEDIPYDKGLFVDRKATKTSTKGKGTKIITNTTSTTYSSGKKYDGNYGKPNFSKSTFSVDTAGYSKGKKSFPTSKLEKNTFTSALGGIRNTTKKFTKGKISRSKVKQSLGKKS